MVLTISFSVVLLTLTFALIMVLTRPTATDRAITKRVAGMHSNVADEFYLGEGIPEFLKFSRLSRLPWFDSLLQKCNLAHDLRLLLAQSESPWSVGSVILSCSVLGLMGGIARFWIDDLIPALAAGAISLAFPVIMLRTKRARRLKRFNQGYPTHSNL